MFYGSQTGTAEEFANRLSKDAHRYGMRGMAADPEEYDLVSARLARHLPVPQGCLTALGTLCLGHGDTQRAEVAKATAGNRHLLSLVPVAGWPPF